ncbi:hypothetical protein H9P43_001563 [Blastocladiella emersonii ATCC 22665]|nr:hypothetical protein H9P43_001563 [Blastocladiella emersonii ATCC 22665]
MATTSGGTGDLRNLLLQLHSELRGIKHAGHLDPEELCSGIPTAYLQIIHLILLEAFPTFTADIVSRGYDLHGKRDKRFMQTVYRMLRDDFSYKPSITIDQFFLPGYAARKLMFLMDLLRRVKDRVAEISRFKKLSGAATSNPTPAHRARRPPSSASGGVPRPSHSTSQLAPPLYHHPPSRPGPADISFTVPTPAPPSSAPAPSTPPKQPPSTSDLSSDSEAEDERRLQHELEQEFAASPPFPAHAVRSNGMFVQSNGRHAAAVAAAAGDGGDSVPVEQVNAIVVQLQSSLATLEATLRGMQQRITSLESRQAAMAERHRVLEDENRTLSDHNQQLLRKDNSRLTLEVETLRGVILQRPESAAAAAAAISTAQAVQPGLSRFASAPAASRPPPPVAAPAASQSRPPVAAAAASTYRPPPTSAVAAPASSSTSPEHVLEEAKQLRDAISRRLASTQALLSGVRRETGGARVASPLS